ncbi:MAG: hypothetical protein ICV64_03860 [Thermoleophilia bacterium]|nr:hypothetical protein [Thermoleophilia bacterium]
MTRLERYARLAGVPAGMLWLAGVLILEAGGNPADPDGTAEIVAHFRDHRTAILAGGTLFVLGGFFFLWFVATLNAALRSAGAADWLRSAALASGAAAGALMLGLVGPQTTGATTDAELLDPGAAVALWRLAHAFFVAAEIAFAAFVAAVSVLALQRVLLPRWLGWVGLAIVVVLLVPPIGWVALIFLVPLWIAAAAVLLFLRPAPVAVPAPDRRA